MADSRTIETTRPGTVVTPVVKIEGTEIPRTMQVEAIVIDKGVNRIAAAKLVIMDGDSSAQKFDASNGDLFVPGKSIEILCGYQSDNYTLFKGVVIKHSIKLRNSGSQLVIECRDKAIAMTLARHSKYFGEKVKDSDAITTLAGNYSGLTADVATMNVTTSDLVQYEATDWDFITARAEANGMLVYTDDNTLSIKAPELSGSPVVELSFGATMLELDAEIDSRIQFPSVTGRTWNPASQEIEKVDANPPSSEMNGNLTADDLAGVFNEKDFHLNHGGKLTQPELQAWATGMKLKQVLSKVRGRVKFKGIHTVKPGMIIKLSNLSDRFNGNAFVSHIQHHVSAGDWQLEVQFGLDPQWFAEKFETSIKPASALIQAVPGLQIGVVTQLESDPDGECRILVRMPVISPDEQGIWARVATLDAGKERGSFFLPEVGDEVVVGFLNSDPRKPVVLGMLNSSNKTAPLQAADANNQKGFVTRSKMKMIFDDDKKSVTIETPAGKKITMDEDAGAIELKDENNNSIKMNSDGITIETKGKLVLKAQQDFNAEGMNVSLKANTSFAAEGSAGVEVKSSGTATLKGAIVQIN
ncbi:type VI secretion system tip protein VgrG [Mucilaginibacter celer]|uniref:Type VI secretion system tip protein VgrG n=1 Tax=Mucilaginibacter celer TaxID=2305508 RepID=A0A494VT46_9SPHI|nr:type VI secretion system tip protein VgrG [Mucilaginibacter celer]AYL94525.1 type VI secretion system tip protein VgrG [Mucilaginibacter celer]